jgi:hypothetical protein
MADVAWTVNTNPDGDLVFDYLNGGHPRLIRGSTQSLEFHTDTRATFETLRGYLDYIDAVATTVGLDGTPYYKELHSQAESLLLLIEPTGADVDPSATGIWAVLVGGDDEHDTVNDDHFAIVIEVFVLAERADYDTRSQAKTAHEV